MQKSLRNPTFKRGAVIFVRKKADFCENPYFFGDKVAILYQ